MLYPGIDYLREKVNRADAEKEYKLPVVIDCSRVSGFDYTSTSGIQSLAKDMQKQNHSLILLYLDNHLQTLLEPSKNTNIIFCDTLESLRVTLVQNSSVNSLSENLDRTNLEIESNLK